MKIKINSKEDGKKLSLTLPTSLCLKLAMKHLGRDKDSDAGLSSAELKKLYTIVKQFRKKNGHFRFIEVRSEDSEITIDI